MPSRTARKARRHLGAAVAAGIGRFTRTNAAAQMLLCLLLGHAPTRDVCGIPAHDFCRWCHRSLPGRARVPRPPVNVQVELADGRLVPVECRYLGFHSNAYVWRAVWPLPDFPVRLLVDHMPAHTAIELWWPARGRRQRQRDAL